MRIGQVTLSQMKIQTYQIYNFQKQWLHTFKERRQSPDRTILHNRHQPQNHPPSPPPPSRPLRSLYTCTGATEHGWQRVMPGRQLSKHCPVPSTESEQQHNGKSVQTAPFLCYQGGKAHTEETKNPLCVCISLITPNYGNAVEQSSLSSMIPFL